MFDRLLSQNYHRATDINTSLPQKSTLANRIERDLTQMNANKELLYQHVKFLTTLRPFRNYQNRESLEKVCHYLKGEFDKYGLESVEHRTIRRHVCE